MKRKSKAWLFFGLLVSMITYVLWTFYISEPEYINNSTGKKLEKYDLVSIADSYLSFRLDDSENENVRTAIVLQTDETFALLKLTENTFMESKFKQVRIKSNTYRIIGRGTFYHKLNSHAGFNIMLISEVLIIIIMIILLITNIELLYALI